MQGTLPGCRHPLLSPVISPFTIRALNPTEKHTVVRPFLRWIGGKQKLLPSLIDRLPKFKGRYFEPFLGGGSLFLAKGFKRAELSDVNLYLINAYRMVRDCPNDVHRHLSRFQLELEHGGEAYYYAQRYLFNIHVQESLPEEAARFIFLMHANYNGVYRVNRLGGYNVPYGHRSKPGMPGLDVLKQVSDRLNQPGVKIEHRGYDTILDLVKKGDFVYMDPPYPVLSRTANFTGYTVERFSEQEQHRLADFAKSLDQRGVQVMISIADVELTRQHYLGWYMHSTDLKRNVSAKRPAIIAKELIITNYPT
jgi:DNA adenine methylase